MSLESNETKRGPGFWKFNNSLLMDKCYTEMITKQIPEFIAKYCNLNDKGLFWEMIKMSRDISIYGRVNIVKTLAISKLTFLCSVLDTPNRFTDEVNNIIFDYSYSSFTHEVIISLMIASCVKLE